MWKSKRVIFAGLLAIAVLVGSMAGAAIAQGQGQGSATTLVSRVAKILGIEEQKVQNAFDQAQKEMREEALDKYLQSLVEQGKITQQQATEYKGWQRSMPNIPQLQRPLGRFGFEGFGRGMHGVPMHRVPVQPTPKP